jgi:quercetin dioxygenase-like cupin family protein
LAYYGSEEPTMQVFDLKTIDSYPYEERDKNVFYKSEKFKARIIELPAGGEMPTCEMASYVIFYVMDGLAEVMVNQEKIIISEGPCLISEPATLSMKTNKGVKIMGIQVVKQ